MKALTRSLWLALAIAAIPAAAHAAAAPVDYAHDVKPLLKARCWACHGALKQEGGLRLDTAEFARKGGEDGRVLVPGNPGGSELVRRVQAKLDDGRMPPEGQPLTGEQISLLSRWISAGATGPADEKPAQDPRRHWAFQIPARRPAPRVAAAALSNPIDAFLADQQQHHGLKPLAEADKPTQLRRLYWDLIGLPPTVAELRDFLDDRRPDAWERVVDRLLANPHYGERWGRHWMDIWRYSDWYGLGEQVRNAQKHMWHWRDWIVESLNDAKGYDRMLAEMLAADEIAPLDTNARRATGFLVRNYFLFNRTTWLDTTVEHTSKAFLGVTLNCAKCHDHKFDPFSQVRLLPLPRDLRAVPGADGDASRRDRSRARRTSHRFRRPPRRADLPLAARRREAARPFAFAGRRRARRARLAGVRRDARQPSDRSVVAVAASRCPRHIFARGRPAGRAGRPRLGECPHAPRGDGRAAAPRVRPATTPKTAVPCGAHPRALCGKVAAGGRGASLGGAGLVESRPRAAEGNFRD